MASEEVKCLMRKIFGTKENAEYVDKKGTYLIPVKDGKVGIVKTPKGFFFLGGGIEKGVINDKKNQQG